MFLFQVLFFYLLDHGVVVDDIGCWFWLERELGEGEQGGREGVVGEGERERREGEEREGVRREEGRGKRFSYNETAP